MLALVGPILSKVKLSGAHLGPRLGQVGPMWSMLGTSWAEGEGYGEARAGGGEGKEQGTGPASVSVAVARQGRSRRKASTGGAASGSVAACRRVGVVLLDTHTPAELSGNSARKSALAQRMWKRGRLEFFGHIESK